MSNDSKVTNLQTSRKRKDAAQTENKRIGKLRWQTSKTAVGPDGSNYEISPSEKGHTAVVVGPHGARKTLVADASESKCYRACVDHNKSLS